MNIRIIGAETHTDIRRFAKVQKHIYAKNRLCTETQQLLISEPGCKVKYFIANDGSCDVGRIAVIIGSDTNMAYFSCLDFEDDSDTADALFSAAETFARNAGIKTLRGPLYSGNYLRGIMTDGFDRSVSGYNYAYYLQHLQNRGFTCCGEWAEYRIPVLVNEELNRISELLLKQLGLTLSIGDGQSKEITCSLSSAENTEITAASVYPRPGKHPAKAVNIKISDITGEYNGKGLYAVLLNELVNSLANRGVSEAYMLVPADTGESAPELFEGFGRELIQKRADFCKEL